MIEIYEFFKKGKENKMEIESFRRYRKSYWGGLGVDGRTILEWTMKR